MTIVWYGPLVLMLNRLQRNLFKATHIKLDKLERIKRLGVYYMSIDELPL